MKNYFKGLYNRIALLLILAVAAVSIVIAIYLLGVISILMLVVWLITGYDCMEEIYNYLIEDRVIMWTNKCLGTYNN